MHVPPPRLALVSLALAACAAPGIPEGEGRGIVGFDRRPPENAETFPAPVWTAGDRLVYLRGNQLHLAMHVEVGADGGYVLVDEASGERQALSAELADLGLSERGPKEGEHVAVVALAPGDQRYHWPLWNGKRWSCHFLRKVPGQPPLPLLVTYAVEAMEDVTVPAGTFRALRILRRASVAAEGRYLDRASLTWYAPALGVEVRRLEDGIVTELAEVHRQ